MQKWLAYTAMQTTWSPAVFGVVDSGYTWSVVLPTEVSSILDEFLELVL